jgi:hypothetical protein
MSKENVCQICREEFASSIGLWSHKALCGREGIEACSICKQKKATEHGAYGDPYCDKCFKEVTTEGEP